MPETIVSLPVPPGSCRLQDHPTDEKFRAFSPSPLFLRAKVVRKITEVPREEWDAVFPPTLEGYSFFKTLDEVPFHPFSFFYVLVYRGESLVGATVCFLMDYPLDTTVQGALKSASNVVKKIAPGFFNLKVLVCGMPMSQGRIGCAKSEDAGEIFEVIYDCLEQLAEEQKVPVVAFKDFDKEYDALLTPLEKRGFYRFQTMPTTLMEIRSKNFEEYMKTLSRASRDGLKRKLKRIDSRPPLDLEITTHPGAALDELYALYLQTVYSHDQMSFEVVPKEFFRRISENMPEETKFFLWRKDGKLLAFAFCLFSKDYFIDYYLGFDYAVAHDYHLYFIRFRDLMNWCIRRGIKTYEMGCTNYESKRRLGFQFAPFWTYAKCRNRFLNPFFRWLCVALKPDNFDPVFKWMKERDRES